MTKLYAKIALTLNARHNCANSHNDEWYNRHTDTLEQLVKDYLPSGSGIDSGCWIDVTASNDNKLIIHTSYHHMNEDGYYDGWTDHTITVVPSLMFGFDLKISGRDRNDIKEYLYQVFYDALTTEVE